MVEFLRRSVAQLQPPTCVSCHIEMAWYRSLRPPGEPEMIAHFFQCPSCNRIAEVKTKMRTNGNGKPTQTARPKMPAMPVAAFAAVGS